MDDLLADDRAQLGRLLDLYLSGDFPKEMLTDRKSRLERTILALEKERVDLITQLEAGTLTDAQVQDVKDFIAKVAPGMDVAEANFGTRRGVIEALNVAAKLTVEDGEKVVRARCVVGDNVYTLRPAESLL